MDGQTRIALVLDDDEAVRESLVAFLEDRSWLVLSAITAEEALKLIKLKSPDVLVVDIRLPRMDGNEFIRIINAESPQMACVICTGSPEYTIPEDIASLPQVSDKIFFKPILDLTALEKVLLKQIDKSLKRKNGDRE